MNFVISFIFPLIAIFTTQVISFKHTNKEWWPSTPFPIITLPIRDFYLNTIFPAVTQTYTFPTIYTTATGSAAGSSGLATTLPTFPTLPTAPTLPALPSGSALPTFPTLPSGAAAPQQILPSFPPLPPSSGPVVNFPPPPGQVGNFPPPPGQVGNFPPPPGQVGNFPPPPGQVVNFPQASGQQLIPVIPSSSPIQCTATITVCPFPITTVVVNLQPQINPYTNCPCIDPRAYYNQPSSGNFPRQGQDCYTTTRLPGFCISIQTCDLLIRFSLKENIFEIILRGEYVQKSMCGFDGDTLLVCCPINLSSPPTPTMKNPSAFVFTFQTLIPLLQSTIKVSTVPMTTTTTTTTTTPAPPTQPRLPSINLNNYNICGLSNFSQSRIVGGTEAKVGQFPWIAALGYLNYITGNLEFYCAGSLITVKHILTTAHCINDNLYLARLGQHSMESSSNDGNIYDALIAAKIIHKNFNPTLVLNDIALLKLKDNVPQTARIRTICLPIHEPIRTQQEFTGYHPFIAGWGTTGFQQSLSSTLQTAQVRIFSLVECEAKYKAYFPSQVFDSRVICAGNGGKDTCQGDSGGPLMLPQIVSGDVTYFYFVLIGIVSYGYECANNNFPGVYTRVGEYIPWILEHLND